MLATAVAALAVRGWALRWRWRGLLAVVSLANRLSGRQPVGGAGRGGPAGADLAHISLVTLVGSDRRYWGAGWFAVVAAVCTLIAAVLLTRFRDNPLAPGQENTPRRRPARSIARRKGARGGDAGGAGGARDFGADDLGRTR